jgi:hypothetical protein
MWHLTTWYLQQLKQQLTFRDDTASCSCRRSLIIIIVNGKVVPLRPMQAHLGDRRYSSYSFLTSALEGGEWSASCPGRALPPGKEPQVRTV